MFRKLYSIIMKYFPVYYVPKAIMGNYLSFLEITLHSYSKNIRRVNRRQIIWFTIVYILIIPTQTAWAYNKRKRKIYNNFMQLFFLKWEILLKRNRFYREKNWLRSVYSPLVRLNTENVAYVKSIINQYDTIYSTLPGTQL